MDGLAGRALDTLVADVRALLPDPGDPAFAAGVGLATARVRRTGLGGFVGLQADPAGELQGRRVDATVAVAVRGADDTDLADRALAVSGALLSVGPADATEGRFLRVAQSSPPPATPIADDTTPVVAELRFDVIYELIEAPADTGGFIAEVPVDVFLQQTGRDVRHLERILPVAGVLDRFDVADDAGAVNQTPSQWAFDASAGAIVQSSAIWGGTTTTTANLPGSALLLKGSTAADLLMRTDVTSSERGVGLVFRYLDPDTYYYVLADATGGFRRFGRKVGGTFSELEDEAVDLTAGYATGQTLRLALEAIGPDFTAYVNGTAVLSGRDTGITGPGRFGLLTRRNPTAMFSSLEVWLL